METEVCVCVCVLVAQSCPALSDPVVCPWGSPSKNTRVGSHSLFQGIFLTQGQNPYLLHCGQILYHLSYQGSPDVYRHICVYISVCVYMYTYICMYMYMYIYISVYIYRYIGIDVEVQAQICMYSYRGIGIQPTTLSFYPRLNEMPKFLYRDKRDFLENFKILYEVALSFGTSRWLL